MGCHAAGLLSLPTEVLVHIVEETEKVDVSGVRYLSQANRRLHEVCKPYVWKSLDLAKTPTMALGSALEALRHRYGGFVEELKLCIELLKSDPDPDNTEVASRISAYHQALAACSALRRLEFRILAFAHRSDGGRATVGALDSVAEFLTKLVTAIWRLTALEAFEFELPSWGSLKPGHIRFLFESKSHLQYVCIRNVRTRDDDTNATVGNALAGLSSLRHLRVESIRFSGWASLEWASALASLEIAYCDQTASSEIIDLINRHGSSLHRLRLQRRYGWPPLIGGNFILPKLQHLEVVDNIPPFDRFSPYQSVKTLVIHHTANRMTIRDVPHVPGFAESLLVAWNAGCFKCLEELLWCSEILEGKAEDEASVAGLRRHSVQNGVSFRMDPRILQ